MTFNPGVNCCPCCKVSHCLNGDTIDDGCCVGCDDLILWSERPSFSNVQETFTRKPNPPTEECPGYIPVEVDQSLAIYLSDGTSGGGPGKYVHYKTYADEQDPVQTLYSYYDSYWRPYGAFNYKIGIPGSVGFPERLLPLLDDPINCDGIADTTLNEFYKGTDPEIATGLLSRCRYDSQFDRGLNQMRTGDCTTLTRLRTCLHLESPCNEVAPISKDGTVTSGCVGQESVKCYGEPLTKNTILEDLSRGYSQFSGQGVSYKNNVFRYEEFFNCCYPSGSAPGSDPCGPPPTIRYPSCTCGSPWLTNYRKRKLMDDTRYTWAVDVECHLNGDFINPSVPKSLSDYWLFNMSNERWWRIKETDDPGGSARKIPLSFWDFPGASKGDYPNPTKGIPITKDPNTGALQGGYCGYSDQRLVPKWWIYGCSSVPFFTFELDDAVRPMCADATETSIIRDAVIEGTDEDTIYTSIGTQDLYFRSTCQGIFDKLSRGGYFESKDWRQDQIKDYEDLDQRFPGKGYGGAAQSMRANLDTIELGPFRKRYYANHILGRRSPYLHPRHVPNTSTHLQAPFYLDYPGQFPTQGMTTEERERATNDYYFWAERQWVYFRGAPHGWTWAGWDCCNQGACLANGCPGVGTEEGEIQAILAGCGRFGGDCIESWFNQPQPTHTVNVGSVGFNSVQSYYDDCLEDPGCCAEEILPPCGPDVPPGEPCCPEGAPVYECIKNTNCQMYDYWVCQFKYGNSCNIPTCRGPKTPSANCCCNDPDPNNHITDGICPSDPVAPCNWNYNEDCEYKVYKDCTDCYKNIWQKLFKLVTIPRCAVPEGSIICSTTDTGPDFDTFDWCGCQTALLQGCPDTDFDCQTANFNSYCNGAHIIVTQYYYENFIDTEQREPICNSPPDRLVTPFEINAGRAVHKRMYQSNTFLTSARNSYEYRQNRCLGSSDRSLRGFWPTVRNSHKIFPTVCEANIRVNFWGEPWPGSFACTKCSGTDNGVIVSDPLWVANECGWTESWPRPVPAGTFITSGAGGPVPSGNDFLYENIDNLAGDGAYCSPQVLLEPCNSCGDPQLECNCWDHSVLGCAVRPECTFGNYSSSWIGRTECPPTCGGCNIDQYLGYNIVCKGTP